MNRYFSRLPVSAVIFALMFLAAGASAHVPENGYADLVEALMPSVVAVQADREASGQSSNSQPTLPGIPEDSPFYQFFKEFFDNQYGRPHPQQRPNNSIGSGFIIDPDGLVVTNHHVVAGATRVTVVLDDGRELDAEFVGVDEKMDLALLRVSSDGNLPAVRFGDSDIVRVGDPAIAIGNPFGIGNTVTSGIISARQRDIQSGPYDDFLQTDAPINRGNSGGPLFNAQGEVIGVNTLIVTPTGGSVGLGFAVPANIVTRVVAQLDEYGRTRRGWLGVRIQELTQEIANAFGLESTNGVLISSVQPDGPAETAGLREGDVIIEFGGVPMRELRELPRAVADSEVGSVVDVTVIRAGKTRTFEVVLGELELAEILETASASPPILGMTVEKLDRTLATRFGLDQSDLTGLVVTDVIEGSAAHEAELRIGDRILSVGVDAVETVRRLRLHIVQARNAGSDSIVVRVERDGSPIFLAIQLTE